MKKNTIYIQLVLLFSLLVSAASAKLTLPALFADHMVLQQQANVPVWGLANPGQQIVLSGSWSDAKVTTRADQKGAFMVKIKTPAAGGPYTLTVTADQTITFQDVMIGEVWICSGQSNMEMPVQGWPGADLDNSSQEIENADYPAIRLFTVARNISLFPRSSCEGSWSRCAPASVASFSAAAYFFGRELYRKLKVPIGLIHSSWGGTVAEAWTSNAALRTLGDFDSTLNTLDSIAPHIKSVEAKYKTEQSVWKKALAHIETAYTQAGYKDSDWKEMKVPTTWEDAGYPNLDGIVWFRKKVNIPAKWAGESLQIELGPIDDNDITYFNGQRIGSTENWMAPRSYNIPGNLIKQGENTIAIRVTDVQGNGGIDGVPGDLKIYPKNAAADQALSLSGNWKYKIAFTKHSEPLITQNANNPSVLYNGMLAPLIPFCIRGAIWYQGESNVGRAAQYAKLFPTLIRNWRDQWQQGNFPFYYVQIAPYKYGATGRTSAALRDAQRTTLTLPNTGMVVSADIGDTANIHPANKQEIGRRLALWALSATYRKKDIVPSGPLFQGIKIQGNKAIVSFAYARGGLIAKGGPLEHFEIAGKDGKFVPATATIQNDAVIVRAAQVTHPVIVRYCWTDTAIPHLYNKSGLPASTFISDTSLY